MKKWVVAMAVLLMIAAAGFADSGSSSAPSGKSPAAPAPITPPQAPHPGGIEGGRLDYRAKCAACHGSNALWAMKTARRMGVDPRKLSLMSSELKREEMISVIEKGRGKMPAFAKELTKERIGYVVDYIVEFRAKRIRQNSMIRQRTPATPTPAPATPSVKSPATP